MGMRRPLSKSWIGIHAGRRTGREMPKSVQPQPRLLRAWPAKTAASLRNAQSVSLAATERASVFQYLSLKGGLTVTAPKNKTTRSEPQASPNPSLDGEIIRVRAYQLYERRGKEDGHDLEDWLRAEEELRQQTRGVAA